MKCHYPDAFACALLNALPMGFYAAATIIEDAKRHGIEVRPADLVYSDWDCTLEPSASERPPHAIRMGLKFIKGVGQADWERLASAR